MRSTNGQDKVIAAFKAGKPANGPKCNNPKLPVHGVRIIRTDGRVVYSYHMPIAFRDKAGIVHLVDYKDGPTKTTKQQIDAVRYEFLGPLSTPDARWPESSDTLKRHDLASFNQLMAQEGLGQ